MTCGIQGKSNAEDDDQVCLFDVIQSKTETLSRNTQNWHLKIFNKENFVQMSWFKTSIFALWLWLLPTGNNSAYSFNPNMQLRWLFISSKDIVYFLSLDKYEHISKQTPFKEYQIVQHYERLILEITDLICLYTMRRISQLVFYLNKNLIWPGVQLWGVCISISVPFSVYVVSWRCLNLLTFSVNS